MKYFLLYLVVEILQLVHEISSFPEVLYKRCELKNFSSFTDEHKKQPFGSVLSKDVLKNFGKFKEKSFCWSLIFNKVEGWKPETVRNNHWRWSVKKVFLKRHTGVSESAVHRSCTQNRFFWIIHKTHRKNLFWSLFLIKLQFWGPVTLLRKTPTKVLSCEICKLSKNNYFEEHLWTSASKLYLKRDSNTGVFCEFCELFRNTYFVKDLRTAGSNTRCPENCPWGKLLSG